MDEFDFFTLRFWSNPQKLLSDGCWRSPHVSRIYIKLVKYGGFPIGNHPEFVHSNVVFFFKPPVLRIHFQKPEKKYLIICPLFSYEGYPKIKKSLQVIFEKGVQEGLSSSGCPHCAVKAVDRAKWVDAWDEWIVTWWFIPLLVSEL